MIYIFLPLPVFALIGISYQFFSLSGISAQLSLPLAKSEASRVFSYKAYPQHFVEIGLIALHYGYKSS